MISYPRILVSLQRDRTAVSALVCVSVIVRIWFLLQVKNNPFLNHPRLDALFHDAWATSIANGNLLGNEVFFRAPLYPYLLGLIYALFGHEYVFVRILQHALGVSSCVLVYFLSRKRFDVKASTLAAFLVAINPMVIYFEAQLLFESFVIFLSLLWLMSIFQAITNQGRLRWFLAGMLLGFLSITRPPYLGIGFLLIAFVLWRRPVLPHMQRSLSTVIPFVLGVCLVILPVTLRNYLVGHDLVLIASQGGVNFYIGNNPAADGISSSMPGHLGSSWENRDETYVVETELGHKPTPSEESSYWYARAFEFIWKEPLSFIALLVKKMYLFWNHVEIPNNLNYNFFKTYSPLLEYNPFGFWMIGPIALLGLSLVAWRINGFGKSWHAQILMVFVLLYFLFTAIFFICDRYRAPILPVLSIFSSYGFFFLLERTQRPPYKAVVRPIVALGVFALFVNSSVYNVENRSDGREYFTLGTIALNENRNDIAIDNFQKALTINPSLPNLRYNLGVAEWMNGKTKLAIDWFRQELTLNPESFGALLSLSRIHVGRRETDMAVSYAHAAIRSKPYLPSGYVWLAKAKLLQGQKAEAESILTLASIVCDENEFVYGDYMLASIIHDQGRLPEAGKKYQSVLNRIKRLGKKQQPLYEPEFSFSLEQKVGEELEIVEARCRYGLGLIFLAKGSADSAIACFVSATTLDPQFGNAFADLGVTLLNLGRADEAEVSLQRAVKLNPEQYLYWFNYGNALAYQGKFEEATHAFHKSLALNPGFSPTRERLDYIASKPPGKGGQSILK